MDGNGQLGHSSADGQVLRWPGAVLSADDLRHALNGHREVLLAPRTVVTPLALEQLRANGVIVKRQAAPLPENQPPRWSFAQDRPHPAVRSAVESLRREGLHWSEFCPEMPVGSPCPGARELATWVAGEACRAGVLFCEDPALVCCVANKVPGLRATPIASVPQAARATLTLGANLLAVEMPGRTFFEIRQILRILAAAGERVCPPALAAMLRELDGHAHR